jgi:DNA polymerase-4
VAWIHGGHSEFLNDIRPLDRVLTLENRRIAHLDMDAFFASVELLRYPDLRGMPVVIGGNLATAQPVTDERGNRVYARLRDYVGRGVVTTSTYEARALGVFSAMGLMKSARLAPDAILLPADFGQYKRYSRLFKAAVADIAPLIEDRGIDEIYIDLSGMNESDETLAARIKESVREKTLLSCSIGIAPNKLLAKICSDLEKPNGTTLLGMQDIPARIWPLPVRKVNGIGPKAGEKLTSLGINTIGELAATDVQALHANFSASYAHWLQQAARGIDDREVVTSSESKSMSRETTFEKDMHARADKAELTRIFDRLCQRLSEDLLNKGYVGKTVSVKLRYSDFRIVTRAVTLGAPTADAAVIRQAGGKCLQRISFDRKFRLLGIKVDNLQKQGAEAPVRHERQRGLFDDDGAWPATT